MGRRRRRQAEGTQTRDAAFFKPQSGPAAGDPFFKPAAAGDAPVLQKEDAPGAAQEEEKKDPITEGLKTTAEKLGENESFKKWYEPRLTRLKYTLWDRASPAEKAAMLSFAGVNLGMAGLAFASNPQLRETLSGVNIGKLLGLIPYSPIDGFSYKLPAAGKHETEFSADFTLGPYLDLWKKRPAYIPSGATFGLESGYDPTGRGFNLTGGKFGLDFLDGALKAEGKTFKSLSPYPMLMPGMAPGYEPTWLMNQTPGMPDLQRPGFQFMLNMDILKLFPGLKKRF
ncbi:hypothetical protein ABU614_18050 [Lysobacter firmicutimachus]|uniref:Uncharacterized protein n=1 Tax=Lysobacter firmicutimachus TaxID=1792846 RepID=A0AAU8MRS3_9GAMM